MNFLDPRLPDRFWDKVQPCPMSGCWIWTGCDDGQGYGKLKVNGRMRFAHRLAYAVSRSSVPDELDHLCRTPTCCNPAHLEAVTHRENMMRSGPVVRATCIRGHLRSAENTRIRPNGKRACRACERARKAHL